MGNWVDITTIDNNTPFTKVRWKRKFYGSQYDSWFAESPGIVSDNMSWQSGGKGNGWFSAHRFNNGWAGNYVYCCCFDFDHNASGFWDTSGQNYQVSLKDGARDQFYDTTVVIDGETYYEVDFSLWQGASGYQLYAPYQNMPWHQGDIYVEVGDSTYVTVDPDKLTFDATGGTKNTTVGSSSDWTAQYDPNNWYHISPSAGTSGDTVVSITADAYTGTTADRTVDITFENLDSDSTSINLKQKKVRTGSFGNVFLGGIDLENMFLGDIELEAMFLGEDQIFPAGPFQGLRVKPSSMTFLYTGGTGSLNIKSSTGWTLTYDSNYISVSQASGGTGDTVVTVTANTNSGQADIDTVITATSVDNVYSATTSVKIKWNQPFPSAPYLFNYNAKEYDASTYTFPQKQGQLFNEDLVLDQAPAAVSADCVSFVGSSAVMLKNYSGVSHNPFNRDSNDSEFTMIYKVGSFVGDSVNLFANRGSGYNYMVRGSFFHTGDSSFLYMRPTTDPYIMLIRVQSDGSCERTVLDASGNVLQTTSSATINWGSYSDSVGFFSGYGDFGGELFNGVFYWMYLANTALTDTDVNTIIDYNENVVQPPQPVPAPTGFTKVTIDSPTPQYNGRYTFAAKYSDNKWYVATTQISNGTGIAREVTYNNDVISNIPSDVLLFEFESAGYYEYYIKQAGTNNYLSLNNSNIVLGPTQSPTVFELGNRVLDGSGAAIDLVGGVVCYTDDNGTYYTAEVNTYIDGDPDPIYAREFMFAQMDSNKAPFVALLFEAN